MALAMPKPASPPTIIRGLILALSALPLAACASDAGEYPSLARRPAERVSGEAPVVVPTPEPVATPDPLVTGQLESLVVKARSADAKFHQRESRARALVGAAAGAAIASESWSVATIALSDLESARSDAMVALAELDTMYAATRIEAADASAIAAARESVMALVADQDKVIDALFARMVH